VLTVSFAAIACAVTTLGQAGGDDASKELQGTWKIVSIIKEGDRVPEAEVKKTSIVVEKSKYKIVEGDKVLASGDIAVDVVANPWRIKLVPRKGADKDETFLGIYEIGFNKLRLCVAPVGKDYPTSFSSTAENKCSFYSLERTTGR